MDTHVFDTDERFNAIDPNIYNLFDPPEKVTETMIRI